MNVKFINGSGFDNEGNLNQEKSGKKVPYSHPRNFSFSILHTSVSQDTKGFIN